MVIIIHARYKHLHWKVQEVNITQPTFSGRVK